MSLANQMTTKSYLPYVLGCLLVISACFGVEIYRLYQPMPIKSGETIIFRVDKSASAKTFVYILKSQHLIHSDRLFLAWIRLNRLSAQLQAGIYQVKQGESAAQLLQRVVHGDVLKQQFRIIEGTTWKQVTVNLAHASYLNYQKNDWQYINVGELTSSPQNQSNLEGLLLADTYQYLAGSHASDLLNQAHQRLKQYLMQSWQQRDPQLTYKNPYELLIVASILEKETAITDERRLISGIIMNRLASHMPLQMDPTIIYGLGVAYNGKLTHDDLQIDSPYNTYRYSGLPPTPIAMVGKDAIDAASHPRKTNYLYFVAKGDGTHIFSETYEQQRRAIKRYLRKAS